MEAAAFRPFVERSSPALLRTAWYLTLDEHLAQDLLQTALVRTWRRWPQLRENGDLEAYVRRVMVTTAVGWRKRRWVGEVPTDILPDSRATGIGAETDPSALPQVLAILPPRQRAAVYLRFIEDLSEARTAEILGCSIGTVKSQVSRALTRLRQTLPEENMTIEQKGHFRG